VQRCQALAAAALAAMVTAEGAREAARCRSSRGWPGGAL
jgi:hypothetical protein